MKNVSTQFSLVMGTLGRSDEIALFIDSLFKQNDPPSWELIIVDQNDDDKVATALQPFLSMSSDISRLIHIKIKKKGLSIARNFGLEIATGQFIAFPDDDCIYGSHVLRFVSDQFSSDSRLDGVTLFDVNNLAALEDQKFAGDIYGINDYNVFQRAISYTIFLRQCASRHRFDERFGVGSVYGATEETDYMFRILGKGSIIKQMGGPVIFHPDKTMDFENVIRAYSYNVGVGAFFAKHLSLFRVRFVLFFLVSWSKLLLRLLQKLILFRSRDQRWYFAIARGRLVGMWRYLRDCRRENVPTEWLQ